MSREGEGERREAEKKTVAHSVEDIGKAAATQSFDVDFVVENVVVSDTYKDSLMEFVYAHNIRDKFVTDRF